jgi:hypothetical protein
VDEDQMKPTMLVIGDSFMSQDERHPGEHWSEMLPEYRVVNLAKGGASLAWIVEQLMDGLAYNPAVVVVGLTDEARITFEYGSKIYSSCHAWELTSDQKLLYTMWLAVMSVKHRYILAYSQISFIFETLRQRNIPFVWHPGLFRSIDKDKPEAAEANRFNFVLDQYAYCEIVQDIWQHPHVEHPIFHIDNLEWQVEFANNVRTLLTTLK